MTAHDLTSRLATLTPSRVRLDGSGGPAPMRAVLDFQASHARARDAIHSAVDWPSLAAALNPLPTLRLRSRATDRAIYIRRPDLGRVLDQQDEALVPAAPCDLCLVVADGLSAAAVMKQAAGLIHALRRALPGLTFGPVALVQGGRVAIGDEIASRMGARLCLTLIGERPGLSVADSLGAYLTFAPRSGMPDSARNCVSNIHGNGGLTHDVAAGRLVWLIRAAMERGMTGVGLKDESSGAPDALGTEEVA